MPFWSNQPVPVVGVSPEDTPIDSLTFNTAWTEIIVGLLEFMLWPDFWEGSSAEVEQHITYAQMLISQIKPKASDVKTVIVLDMKGVDEPGGACVAGWQRRELNTVVGDTELITLANNTIYPIAGRYHIHAYAPAFRCVSHKLTMSGANTYPAIWPGSNAYSTAIAGENDMSVSTLDVVVDIAGTEGLTFDHWTYQERAVMGLGTGTLSGMPSVFTTVILTRLGD